VGRTANSTDVSFGHQETQGGDWSAVTETVGTTGAFNAAGVNGGVASAMTLKELRWHEERGQFATIQDGADNKPR
jgi:hypothetical protein